MLNFENFLDLPLIWGGLLGVAVLVYVLLDGFDLGVGILFPFAPSDSCRNKMINSIAPFWDGNETWLVLGGGGLFVAFPMAYAIIMPALYIPVIMMLLALIFRGVAFEFRFKADKTRWLWDYAFHFGSLGAAFFQGVILGGIVKGFEVEGRAFAGGPFDWLSGFSIMSGMGVVFGYTLLGATWLVYKTEHNTQDWARKSALYVMILVAIFMGLVSLWVPFLDNKLNELWFGNAMWFLVPIPVITGVLFAFLFRALRTGREVAPFLLTAAIFFMGYLGLGISLYPYIVPYQVTFWDAAAAPESLSLVLIGAVVMLPIILGYVGYCYYLFRGKVTDDPTY